MKKEIRQKISGYKTRVAPLILKLKEEPGNPEAVRKLQVIEKEIAAWLQTIVGDMSSMTPQELSSLENMFADVQKAVLNAGQKEAELSAFISASARRIKEPQPYYERIVDDKSQVAVLAEESACDRVAAIEKFIKKKNRKPFLNISICKFRKSKQQAAQESENGSNGPVNG